MVFPGRDAFDPERVIAVEPSDAWISLPLIRRSPETITFDPERVMAVEPDED